jgi:hypothetical protein
MAFKYLAEHPDSPAQSAKDYAGGKSRPTALWGLDGERFCVGHYVDHGDGAAELEFGD